MRTMSIAALLIAAVPAYAGPSMTISKIIQTDSERKQAEYIRDTCAKQLGEQDPSHTPSPVQMHSCIAQFAGMLHGRYGIQVHSSTPAPDKP